MPPATVTTEQTTLSDTCRQRAKDLVARLRHRQLLSAMSGRVVESAGYARRVLRIRRAVCTCCA
jgi:hypothetical protein